jgi:hypothetical protein
MKTNEFLSWFVILGLAVGFAYLHKRTVDLEREIEHLRGTARVEGYPTIDVGRGASESAAGSGGINQPGLATEMYSTKEVPVLDETEGISELNQEVYQLGRAVRELAENQGVLMERHNGLILVIEKLNWSFQDQIRINDPNFNSPIGGVELSLVLIREWPTVLGSKWGIKDLD